ncbi:MAG: MBL fold metallo-hydrolase [Pseudomonadota bacterium]
MRKLWSCGLVICCFFLFVNMAHTEENGLVQITDHVYAYLDVKEPSPANSFGANAGIIIGEKGIVVIDTLISAREAQRFIQDIRKISDKPIKYVVNTHYHLDHSFGNAEFAKLGAVIVCQTKCGNEMRQKAADSLANAKNYGLTAEDMAGTKIAYPDMTFTERARLELGDIDVDLIHVAPSHSSGSILVYIPSEKVVFAGDILFTDFHPYMGDGDLTGWQQALDFLATLDADRIIPGHGPLSGEKDVTQMKDYITSFDRKARELTTGASTLEEVVAELKKSQPERSRGEWLIGANVQAKYLKAMNDGKN